MIRTLLCSTVLAMAAPAVAQPASAVPSPQDRASAIQPSAPTAPAQNAMPSGSQAATTTSPASSVAAIVDSEFPAYDANADGQLDQGEFSRWMVALKDQEMKATGAALPAEQITAWATGAFTSADVDKSAAVSKPELVTYLSGGAG